MITFLYSGNLYINLDFILRYINNDTFFDPGEMVTLNK